MSRDPASPDRTASPAAIAPRIDVPLVATKIRAPVLLATFLERPRLDTRLDAALDEAARLTILSAPPGYGKSVAALAWLRARALPHAWLSLEPADNDPVRFVRHLVAALRVVRPGAGQATMSLMGAGTSRASNSLGPRSSTRSPRPTTRSCSSSTTTTRSRPSRCTPWCASLSSTGPRSPG